MQAQMGLVSGLAKEHPDFKDALDATDSERPKEKVKIQKALASTERTRLPPPLAPGQHTASRIGAAGPGYLVLTIGDTDLNSVYSWQVFY